MADQRCSLGATIRARRLELGWSQEELAERISTDDEYVRQSEISRIESGRVTLPRRRRLEMLAAALDIPLGELLARSGWAGAEHAFDKPALRVVSGPAMTPAGPFRQRSRMQGRRAADRPTEEPATSAGDALERRRRLEQIREATRAIQTGDEHRVDRLDPLRRQYTGGDLSAGTP